jgi:carboxypeptidase C (cathepsin A)
VNAAFVHAGDRLRPAAPYLGALLARGVRVLVYAGARDPVCSWVAQARMTAALEWPGAGAFRRAEWAEWKDAEGEVLGSAKEAGGLRLVKVDGAGHMVRGASARTGAWSTDGCAWQVPHDKPEAALLMLEQWLSDEPLLKS